MLASALEAQELTLAFGRPKTSVSNTGGRWLVRKDYAKAARWWQGWHDRSEGSQGQRQTSNETTGASAKGLPVVC